MKLKIFILGVLALCGMSVSAAENYFRPGTVWTIIVSDGLFPRSYIMYNAVLDEVTFEGEKVLPFVRYTDEDPTPIVERYLRTEGDKVYWRSTNPKYPNWYLLYDFGLMVGDETIVYNENNSYRGIVTPVALKCLRYDYYFNDNPLEGPLMRLQVLKYGDRDCSSNEHCQGDWIIGMGFAGGPGNMMTPFLWGWDGGSVYILCVESPKGNVVYGEPVAGINVVSDSESSQPAIKGVYNLQGIRVADTTENLPAGLYIVNGKKQVVGNER